MTADNITRVTQMQAIADFLQKVLPKPRSPTPPVAKEAPSPPPTRRLGIGMQTTPEKKTAPTLEFRGNIRLVGDAQARFRRNQ